MVWHHAWYTGDAQCMSLAVLCPPHPLFKEGELWGKSTTNSTHRKRAEEVCLLPVCLYRGRETRTKPSHCGPWPSRDVTQSLAPSFLIHWASPWGCCGIFLTREPSCVGGITMARFSCRQEQPHDTVLAQEMEVRVLMG